MTTVPLANPPRPVKKSIASILAHLGISLFLLILIIFATALGPFYYLILAGIVVWTIWLRYYLEAFISVFGLPLLASAFAVATYLTGSGKFHYMGLPHMESFNIDPVYRCGSDTGGCIVNGNEWITEDPYNFTLQALITVFGPERGSYTGPYSTESDATTALATAIPIDLTAFSTDQFNVGLTHIRLDAGVGKRFLKHWLDGSSIADYAPGGIAADTPAIVNATIWKDRVLLLRGPAFNPLIAAIDLNAGRPFAFYHGIRRFPPVMWRKADDFP
jgi:hypothetical protein